METPGTLLAVMKAETAFSICERFSGERVLSCAAAEREAIDMSNAARKKESGRDVVGCRRLDARRNMSDLRAESLAQNADG